MVLLRRGGYVVVFVPETQLAAGAGGGGDQLAAAESIGSADASGGGDQLTAAESIGSACASGGVCTGTGATSKSSHKGGRKGCCPADESISHEGASVSDVGKSNERSSYARPKKKQMVGKPTKNGYGTRQKYFVNIIIFFFQFF